MPKLSYSQPLPTDAQARMDLLNLAGTLLSFGTATGVVIVFTRLALPSPNSPLLLTSHLTSLPPAPPSFSSPQGYRGGLRSSQVVEHLTMMLTAAEKSHSPVPVCRSTLQLYTQVLQEGLGDQDFASIYRYVYGSGSSSREWRAGDQLWNSTH